jgi:hypothetical protein
LIWFDLIWLKCWFTMRNKFDWFLLCICVYLWYIQ